MATARSSRPPMFTARVVAGKLTVTMTPNSPAAIVAVIAGTGSPRARAAPPAPSATSDAPARSGCQPPVMLRRQSNSELVHASARNVRWNALPTMVLSARSRLSPGVISRAAAAAASSPTSPIANEDAEYRRVISEAAPKPRETTRKSRTLIRQGGLRLRRPRLSGVDVVHPSTLTAPRPGPRGTPRPPTCRPPRR